MFQQSRLLCQGLHAVALSALTCASVAVLAVTSARPAQAQGTTILTFDPASSYTEGTAIPQNYGDNVTAATMGSFQYGGSNGFTPNVTVTYGGGLGAPSVPQFHQSGYGDLQNYIQGPLDQTTSLILVTLTPEAGYSVTLNSVDLATLHNSTFTINGLQVFGNGGTLLYNQPNATVTGGAASPWAHSHYDFTNVTSTGFVTLQIDASNLVDKAGAIALDNISFTQNRITQTAAPEPGTFALLSMGALSGLGILVRRHRLH
jgi:hypothetical protein